MRIRRFFAACLFALLGCPVLFSQASATPDPARSPIVLDIGPGLWGLDLGVGYRAPILLPAADTILWAYGGGAYETQSYQRMPDGSLISGAAPGTVAAAEDIPYDRWSVRWQLGIMQGLAWNPRIDSNLLGAVLFYRGRYDSNIQTGTADLLFLSSLPDRLGVLLNAFLVGVTFDDVLLDARAKTKSGISAELSGEWGPAFLFNAVVGSADYLRFNLTARAFLPLFDAAPAAPASLFSVYLADFFSADYVLGSGVPLHVRQTFGGLKPRTGLGGALRGVDTGSLDVNLKAVNNLELRANLPAIVIKDIVPGVLAYWDAGAYMQTGEGLAVPPADFVTSVGAGVYVDFFDFAQLIGYIHYRLIGVNADGSALNFGFDFVLKF